MRTQGKKGQGKVIKIVDWEASREGFQVSPFLTRSLARIPISVLITTPVIYLTSFLSSSSLSPPAYLKYQFLSLIYHTCCLVRQLLHHLPALHAILSSSVSLIEAIATIQLMRANLLRNVNSITCHHGFRADQTNAHRFLKWLRLLGKSLG